MGRLYTFTEFAKAAGVTPQYLYKIAGNGKIKDFIVYDGGKKKIKGEALDLFKKADSTVQGEPDAESILIETLREQIRIKDQQLSERDREIKDLTESVKAYSAIQYQLNQRLMLLEQAQEQAQAQQQAEQSDQPQEPPQGANNAPQAQPEVHAQPKPDQRGLRGWFARFLRQ